MDARVTKQMKHGEGFMKGVRDTSIYYQCWLPEGEPKAILLVVHGLSEHSGRYMNVVNHLVPSGYAVYGIDHIGHGKSDGARAYVERFEDYTKTLKMYLDIVKEWHPNNPIFLIGHSMGGLVSAAFLLEHQNEISGAVLSGPAIKVPDNTSQAIIVAGKVFSILMPKVRVMGLNANTISRDPKVVDAYVNDPLVFKGKGTARLGAEILKTMQSVTQQAAQITLPTLILQGSDDEIVDPSGAQLFCDSAGSTDKTLKICDGLYHEVFNEPEHDQVLNDVKVWLEAHLSAG
jgi:alpha-beta hydrolase superfamily lysophospholipase